MTLEDGVLTLIEAGSSLVVGTVSVDGEPRAHRALAAWVCHDDEPQRIRFVMSGDDPDLADHLASGSVSLTGANIVTYRSAQFKGRAVVVEAPTAHDLELAIEHSEVFFEVVQRVDRNPLTGLRRMLPHRMLAVEMVVESIYDQTPGPRAGATLQQEPPVERPGTGSAGDQQVTVP